MYLHFKCTFYTPAQQPGKIWHPRANINASESGSTAGKHVMGQQIDKPLSDVSYIQKYCLNPYITYQNANVNIVEASGRHTRLPQMIAIYTNFEAQTAYQFRTADK